MSTKLFEIECPLFRTEDHVEPALCQVLREFSAMPEGTSAKKQTRLIPEPGLGYRSQKSKIIYRVDKRHPLDWVKTNAGRLVQQIVFHKVDFTFSVETADRAGYIYKINDHAIDGTWTRTRYFSADPRQRKQIAVVVRPVGDGIQVEFTPCFDKNRPAETVVLVKYPGSHLLTPEILTAVRRGATPLFVRAETLEGTEYFCRAEDIATVHRCVEDCLKEANGELRLNFPEEPAESPAEPDLHLTEENLSLTEVLPAEEENSVHDEVFPAEEENSNGDEVFPAVEETSNGDEVLPLPREIPAETESKTPAERECDVVLRSKEGHFLFAGEVEDGKKSGAGILRLEENGYFFLGSWTGDSLNGIGSSFDSNGVLRYCGEWKDGRHHGIGTTYRANGTKSYSGGWENGTYHGRGTFYCRNGYVFEAVFVQGIPTGRGILSAPGKEPQAGRFFDRPQGGGIALTEPMYLCFVPDPVEKTTSPTPKSTAPAEKRTETPAPVVEYSAPKEKIPARMPAAEPIRERTEVSPAEQTLFTQPSAPLRPAAPVNRGSVPVQVILRKSKKLIQRVQKDSVQRENFPRRRT